MPSALTCHAEREAALSLGELRRLRQLSQLALAGRLKVSQPHIAQFEAREDMLLSTLRRYLEALGGELEILAHFPGRRRVEIALPAEKQQHQPDNNSYQSGSSSC